MKISLGAIFPTQSEFLKHLTKYGNLTDNEITEMATTAEGLNASEAISLHAERDFCKSISNNIVNSLITDYSKENPLVLIGRKVRIKDNLRTEMERLKFIPTAINSMIKFVGTEQEVLNVYVADKENNFPTEEWFVTIEAFCEIPLNACELV